MNLPHRPPFLFLDKILDIEKEKRGAGIKCITANEPFTETLIIECMAQVSAVVFSKNASSLNKEDKKIGYLGSIRNMMFKRNILPGDQIIIEVSLIQKFGNLIKVHAKAHVKGELLAKGELTFSN